MHPKLPNLKESIWLVNYRLRIIVIRLILVAQNGILKQNWVLIGKIESSILSFTPNIYGFSISFTLETVCTAEKRVETKKILKIDFFIVPNCFQQNQKHKNS